jgi:hypothetical protein
MLLVGDFVLLAIYSECLLKISTRYKFCSFGCYKVTSYNYRELPQSVPQSVGLFNTLLIVIRYIFQAYSYEENYPSALAGFTRASQLDPSWPDPQTHESHLVAFLSNVQELTQAKVKLCVGVIFLEMLFFFFLQSVEFVYIIIKGIGSILLLKKIAEKTVKIISEVIIMRYV